MKYLIFITTLFFFFTPLCVSAAEPFVYATENNSVVYNNGGSEIWPIASLTKLMTAMVLADMKLNWNAPVALVHKDELGGARLRVRVGQAYRRIDLLHASLMGSANNATHALARTSGLTMAQFVTRMNAKARELGMVSAHFVDPTGLDIKNTASAEDVALLVTAARHYTLIHEIGMKKKYTLLSLGKNPREHTIKSTNKLLREGESVELGKTGYLVESQYNFAMVCNSATGGERTVVVLGAPSESRSFQIARQYANLPEHE